MEDEFVQLKRAVLCSSWRSLRLLTSSARPLLYRQRTVPFFKNVP